MFSVVKYTFVFVLFYYYFGERGIYAGDVSFARCDTNLLEYTLSRINIIDSDPTQPDKCDTKGCTVYADHSYNLTIDACVNLPSAIPITSLPFEYNGILTLADGGLPLLDWNIQLDKGDLCHKIDPSSARTSCPVLLTTASPTSPICATAFLHVPAPYLQRALSCLPLPVIARPGVGIARIWKNTKGSNEQADLCVSVPATYSL